MPINTNVVTTGQFVGKTGTVTFRPYAGAKVPLRVPPRSTVGGKSVPSNVMSQNVSSKSVMRPKGGKRLAAVNKSIVKRKVNRDKLCFKRIKNAKTSTADILCNAHFERLLRECLEELNEPNMRMSAAFKADAKVEAQDWFIGMFEEFGDAAIHRGCVTVCSKDNYYVRHYKGELDSRAIKKVAIRSN